jgi:hypothetical protein
VFGFQHQHLYYERSGDTPTVQAILKPSNLAIGAWFCSSACCKQQLGNLLETQGFPGHLQHNRVQGGPIAPCGKCGKPVDMSEHHGAWIKGKVTADIQHGEDATPDWVDVLTVVCLNCAETAAKESVEERIDQPLYAR